MVLKSRWRSIWEVDDEFLILIVGLDMKSISLIQGFDFGRFCKKVQISFALAISVGKC